MTATLQPPAPGRAGRPQPGSLVHGVLPAWTPLAVLAGSFAVATAVMSAFGFSLYGIGALGYLLTLVVLTILSRRVEGKRKGKDRMVTTLVYGTFGLAMLPLISLVWTVLHRGLPGISAEFFTSTMRGVLGEGGGIAHAIVGTLLVTGLAALISVPIGLLTAIYLVEYGRGRLARWVTFLVDVMTGIPSIVAGLFAYALLELFYGPGIRMGAGGSIALAVLMIPVVVRARRPALAHHRQGCHPDGHRGHRHRRHPGDRARHRRDRPAADHLRSHHQHEHQPVRGSDDDAAGVRLLLLRDARASPGGRLPASMVGGTRADRDRDAPQPGGPDHLVLLRPQDVPPMTRRTF